MGAGGGNTTATLTLNANMDPSGVLSAVKTIQGSFNSLKINPNLMSDMTKEFGNLQKLLENYRKELEKKPTSKKDIKNLENMEKAINSSFSSLSRMYNELNGQTIMTKVDSTQLDRLREKTQAARQDLQNAFSNINVGSSTNGLSQIENSIEKAVNRSKTLKSSFAEAFSSLTQSGDVNKFSSSLDSIFNNISGKFKKDQLKTTVDNLLGSFSNLGLIKIDTPLETTAQKLLALKNGFDALKTAIANGASGEELQTLIQKLEQATKAEKDFQTEAEKRGKDNYSEQIAGLERLGASQKKAAEEARVFKQQTLDATTQLEQLQSSTQYFFSLRNMFSLLRRGLREAIDTIKELDAAMTETAVVTKFDVGDMWGKLPEYVAQANALGATIQDMYESTTLYYQQGLNSDQAMGIASETMKMARIGGLEAADATDKMTAALRGFNMELSEASAQRINDVYSNLAAKTASNTQELGEAMQRTASIASNAGMSFEGTAAFLAQAIETTREPAENIGTAMKTIIARMQEMKKNPLEIGEVDGEQVDYNKIDAALKSVGISIKKANGDFRDNDEVLLDISKKWDSLSQTQQRYIATTIAGSRQQSRFIAMVGNYERTQELMDYANNAEGASQEQFGKTLDSLAAKLNKFSTAWQEFLMNIMNDSWTKGLVSGATTVLNTVNKLIDTLSFGNKGIKSVLTLFTAFNALKVAGRGANMLIGGIGGMMSPGGSFKQGFLGGATGLAGKNTNRIIAAINNLVPHIDKAAMDGPYKYTGFGNYKTAQKELAKQVVPDVHSNKQYSMKGVMDIFDQNKLNKEQQSALLKSMPGLKRNMTRALATILKDAGADPATVKGLVAGFKAGEPLEQVLKKGGLLTDFKTMFKMRGEAGGKEAAEAFARAERNTLSKEERRAILQEGRDKGYKDNALRKYYREQANLRLQNTKSYAKNPQAEEALNATRELTKSEAAANTLNIIGSAATSAGMSLQMFGSQLAVTNPIIGETIAQLGNLVMMLGTVPNAMAGIIAGGPLVWGIAAAVATLGVFYADFAIKAKKATQAAEEIQKKFETDNAEIQKNIATLKQYQQQAGQWAQGVDKYGNNVSLSDDEYNQYLSAVEEIAKINPAIVEGYNAQGRAIININKALSDTLATQNELQTKNFTDYLDPSSLDKIVKARDVNANYLDSTTTLSDADRIFSKIVSKAIPFVSEDTYLKAETWLAKTANSKLGIDLFVQNTTPFQEDVQDVVKKLQEDLKTEDLSNFLSPFQIDWEKLSQNDEAEIKKFVLRRDDIYSAAMKEVTKDGGELSKGFTEAFTTLDDNTGEFEESIDATVKWLSTYVSQSDIFSNLSDELKLGVNEGLKDIALLDDPAEMISQADTLIGVFDDLTREGGAYATAMDEVEAAQDTFASSLDASEYAKNTENALTTLNNLLKEYEGNTTAYGQAITEYLTNQIERIKSFTTEGAVSLTEALNTATTEITAAEGAYQAFQDATKTDMSTGADNMKSIFDEITKDTEGVQLHMQSKGDNTLWKGMEAMFSEDAIQKAAEKGPEAVQSMLNRIKPMLQEGQAGFDAFWNDMFSNENVAKLEKIKGVMIDQENGEIKWDDDINPDVFHEMAEALGYADQYLASMLNKGRQFADIDFMDTSDVRKALSTDSAAIKGTSTTTITNDQGKTEAVSDLFVKEDYLKNALRDSGLSNPVEIKDAIDNMTKNGVKIIPNPNDMTKKDFKNMGITDIPSLVRTLGDTGQFNRSEIEEYAKQLPNYNAEELDIAYKDYLDSQEHPELPSLNSIDSNVASIASAIIGNRMAEGHVDEATVQAYEEAKRLVNGENGHNKGEADSVSELFALGKNSKGEALSKTEYDATLKLLNKQIDDYTRKSEQAEQGAEKARAEGRDAEADELLKEARGYRELAKRVEEDRGKGEEVHKNLQNADESTQQKAAGMPSDVNQILDKQKQDRELQEKADQKKSEALAKQTEEYNKQKKAQEEAEKVRTQGLVEQTKQYNQQKEEQKKAQEEAEKVRAQGLVKQTEEINKQKESEQIAENAVSNTAQGVQKSGEYITGVIANSLAEGIQEEANKTDGAAYSGIKKINPGSFLGSMLEKIWPDSDDLKFENTDTNTWGTRNLNNSRKNLWNSLIEGWDSLFGEEDSIPEEGDTSFVSKVESSAQKLGEALKKGWDALHQNTPPEPTTPAQPSSPTQTASTVSQGGNVVAGVAQQVVQTVSTQEQGLDETKQKLESINSTANKGADMKVKASSDGSLTTAEKALNKLKGSAASGATIKVNSGKGDTVGKVQQNAAKGAEMPLKIRDLATSKINQINANARKPVSKTVNISPNYTGTWRKEVYISKTGPGANAYTGVNNKISFHHVPMAGSLARGTKKGRIGPRNQGGLTLTGEKGYEIAWIPSESRSAILGASGPEMVNLPKEAVVYNHDQSKEIMKKRKSIPAGSMGGGSGSASYKPGSSSSTPTTTTIHRSTGSSIGKTVKNTGDKVAKDTENATKKVARVSVWWENIARRTESTQRKMDNNAKEFEKYIKNINATLTSTGTTGKGNAYIQNIKDYINLNAEQVGRANAELKQLNTGTGKNSEKKGAQKKLKSKYKKGDVNITEISYENDKGKSKKKFVNLAPYIKKDEATGALQVDEDELKKISNVNKRKAVAEAANKEIDERTSKKTKAEDAIQKAQEALEKMGQDLYETFFKWETELTKIWNITQKIEAAEARAAEAKEGSSLLEAKLASGRAKADKDFAQQSIDMYKSELNSEVKALEQRAASVKEKQDALNRAINIDDEISQLNSITNKLNSAIAARTKADKAEKTLNSKQAQLKAKQEELNKAKKGTKKTKKTKKNKKGEQGTISYTVYDTKLINKLEKEVKQLEGEVKTAKQTYNTAQNATMKDTDRLGYETYAQQLQQDIKAQQLASKYTTITRMGDGTVEVQVDTKSLMDAKDAGQITEAEAKRIEDYIKNIQDSNKDLQDTYKDITSGMTELYSRLDTLQKDWTDYADQLWDISDKEEQERINELKDLSNSINNAMKKLLDDVKKKLDERRQQEDNAKTEAEISQKQQRLTMLRADTSGGHAVEIAQLEQELADARQNYERSLEDQLLEKLQNQSDVAQEQRERMIELEEGIKDAVNNAALVNEWMAAAQQASLQGDPAILEKYREQMYNAYMAAHEADKKPEVLQQSLETSFNTLYNGLLTNQAEQEAVNTQLNALEGTKADIKDAKSLLGKIFEQLEKMNTEVSSQKDPNAGKGAEEAIEKSENAVNASKTTATATANKKTNAEIYKEKLAKYTSNGKLSTNELSYILSYGKQAGKSEREVVKALANTKVTWKDIITEAKKNKYSESKVRGWFSSSWSKGHKESFAKAFNSIYKPKKKMKEKYATGGLNTYTGPAWLDGTPSKPELVLNAQDTKNFIALKDVLSKAVSATGQISDSYGNATYEININVDHLNSDYDVDKVVERVKKKIVQDSGYRNVTQVRNFR